ncbi:MAG: CHAT domain-containing protein [Planctomycetota bacterium]
MTLRDQAAELRDRVWSKINSDAPAALTAAQQLHALVRRTPDGYLRAAAQHAMGCCRLALGQAALAERWLSRAASTAHEFGLADAAAHSEVTRIQALLHLGRTWQALAEAKRLALRERRRGNAVGEARALVTAANVRSQLHQPARALTLLNRGHQLLLACGQADPQIAALQINRGNVLTALGRPTDARDAYQFVRQWADRVQQPRLACEATYNEAVLWVKSGSWQIAYDLFEEIRPRYAELGDRRGSTLVDLDEAELLLRLGLSDDAIELASAAIEGAASLGLLYHHGRALLVRGSARQQEEPVQAVADFQGATGIFRSEGNTAWEALAHVALGGAHLRTFDDLHALDEATTARELLVASPVAFVSLQARELQAQCYLRLGMLEPALAASRAAVATLRRAPVPWLREVVWLTRGRIHLARGNRSHALRSFARAAREVELSRAFVLSEPLGFSFLRGRAEVFEELLSLHLEHGDPANGKRAFAIAQRAATAGVRGASPLEAASPASFRSATVSTGEAAIEAAALRLQGLYQRLAPTDTATTTSAQQHLDLESEVAREERRLLRLLRRRPLRDNRAYSARVTAVRAAQVALGPARGLIEYFRVKGRLGAFVLTANSFATHADLGPIEAFDRTLLKLRFQLERGLMAATRGDVRTRSEACRAIEGMLRDTADRVLWPLTSGPLERCSQWAIVPAGSLASLPFAALPLPGGGCCLDLDLTVLSSREQLAAAPTRIGSTRPMTKVVAIGTTRSDLPQIASELDSIRALIPNAVMHEGSAATVSAFRTAASSADVLHVACHAAFRSDNPYYSALELADGWVPAWEVARQQMAADLVVLSACESGRLHSVPGDHAVGLGRALLTAGVQNLVVSLWRVRDEVAAYRAHCFYRQLAMGLTVRSAHREATIELRRRFPDPWDWANAALVGPGDRALRFASGNRRRLRRYPNP